MPTLVGLRRRGYTPESIRDFVSRVGMSKTPSTVDIALLEHCLREDLNKRCRRAMAVVKPVKLVIENWPAGKVEEMEAVNNPEDPSAGTRMVPFTGELYIEQDDVREVPPPKYYRLYPGNQVRLRYAYVVTCTSVRKDPSTGEICEVRCTYDPATRGGNAPDNRKVKATIHWVSAGARDPRRGAAVRSPFFVGVPAGSPRGRGLDADDQSPVPGGREATHGSSQAWPRPGPANVSSSSGWAISSWMPTVRPMHSFSIDLCH